MFKGFQITNPRLVNRETGEETPLPTPSELFSPPSNSEDRGRVYTLVDALEGLSISCEITGTAARDLIREFHRMELKHYVAPLMYRVQPPRSEIVKVAGEYLTTKAAFTRRLLKGEE